MYLLPGIYQVCGRPVDMEYQVCPTPAVQQIPECHTNGGLGKSWQLCYVSHIDGTSTVKEMFMFMNYLILYFALHLKYRILSNSIFVDLGFFTNNFLVKIIIFIFGEFCYFIYKNMLEGSPF